jgi:hypothetical protein
MGVRVVHSVGDLERDLRAAAAIGKTELPQVVRKNLREGIARAKVFARASAGPHGEAYYKRISGEMTGPLSAEFGPSGSPKTEFVGVGFRHGHNLDLPRTADIIGPQMAGDVGDVVDRMFWP